MAVDIFDWCWTNGWDSSGDCGGGIWFDNNYNAKQTIENVQMFQLGYKLQRLTGNKTFGDRAKQVWKFMTGAGILDRKNFKVNHVQKILFE